MALLLQSCNVRMALKKERTSGRVRPMKLIIIHYHLRPGGIRRIIELATPHLVRQFKEKIEAVVLATGERADQSWVKLFQRQMADLPLVWFVDPAFNYLSEQKQSPQQIDKQLSRGLEELLVGATPDNALIWAHNLGVGRNLLLTRALTSVCAGRGLKLVLHHHDWWFDNRWRRWPEMRRSGFGTLSAAAKAIFPVAASVRHLAINRSDAAPLQREYQKCAGWLPNLVERGKLPLAARVKSARKWLSSAALGVHPLGCPDSRSTSPDTLKGGHRTASVRQLRAAKVPDSSLAASSLAAPIWILPCRMLRRKNVAEALLLTRWLRPEAWLVTTGGASSADEQSYFDQIASAARRHGWPLRLGILQGDETHKPTVAELLAASEAVLLTSIQEGFGLPYLEAAAAGRPLIARALPNVAPDLEQFGFRFPQYYDEIQIDPALFDWVTERQRQTKLFRSWRQRLPRAAQGLAGQPVLLAGGGRPRPVPFSRLTLAAQLEVLAQPAGDSWSQCAPLNPFLSVWRRRSAAGTLQATRWPRGADRWLSGPAYAQRFADLALRPVKRPASSAAGQAVQQAVLREKLRAEHLFPLLWDR